MVALIVGMLPTGLLNSVVLFAAVTGFCRVLGAKFATHREPLKRSTGIGPLAMRGILAGLLVALVTATADRLGAAVAGLLLAFPVGYSVVALTAHQKYGAASVTALLHSAVLGTVSLAGFCLALALTASWLPSGISLGTAVIFSLIITFGLIWGAKERRADGTASP